MTKQNFWLTSVSNRLYSGCHVILHLKSRSSRRCEGGHSNVNCNLDDFGDSCCLVFRIWRLRRNDWSTHPCTQAVRDALPAIDQFRNTWSKAEVLREITWGLFYLGWNLDVTIVCHGFDHSLNHKTSLKVGKGRFIRWSSRLQLIQFKIVILQGSTWFGKRNSAPNWFKFVASH